MAVRVRKNKDTTLSSSITAQSEKPWQEKSLINSEDRGKALWRAAVNDKLDPNGLSTNKIYTYDWNGDFTVLFAHQSKGGAFCRRRQP